MAVIDIVDQAQSIRDYMANLDDLKAWEKENGPIPEESVVILRSGWSRFWPDGMAYFGTSTNDDAQAHFPGLHPDAAKWLIQNRKVHGVGIDGPSIDCGQCGGMGKPSHVALCSANVYIIENVEQSIFKVPQVGATITVLPLKLAHASGSPVRAIIQFSHDHGDTNASSQLSIPYLWMVIASLIIPCFVH